nr:MAG TPA: hypothetical protein [Caudoviricetes sp.]
MWAPLQPGAPTRGAPTTRTPRKGANDHPMAGYAGGT